MHRCMRFISVLYMEVDCVRSYLPSLHDNKLSICWKICPRFMNKVRINCKTEEQITIRIPFFEQVQRIEEFWQKERGICDNDCRLLVQSQMQTRIRSACWKKWEMNANGCGRSIFGQCFYQSVVHWICPPLRSALFGWKLALLILIFTIARIK